MSVECVQDSERVIKAIHQVLEQCRQEWTFYAPARPEFLAQRWLAVCRGGAGVTYVDYSGARARGLLLGLFVPCMITGVEQALEYFWLEVPGYRRYACAMDLLAAFEQDAKARGCKQIIVGSSQFVRPEAMRRLYRRLGYVPHAEAFRKDLV
jgi:GNAT superfamily N-acetyltransferase